VLSEILARVASQDRSEREVRRAEQGGVADGVSGARDLEAVERQAESLASLAGEVGAALDLGDAGDLPAVDNAAERLVPREPAEGVRIGDVEDVGAVGGLYAIVVGEVEGIEGGTDDPESLAEGVV